MPLWIRFVCCRAGLMRITSQARWQRSSPAINHALGSTWRRPRPCRAEVGNAWWLLCHASPKAIGASQPRLRDSSPVANGRRPKKWHRELMLKVT